ncbi:MAG: exodeoxyribonuclease VII small subunit [Bacteriovoracales bacterium]|nr:exodeoxyribonuclease VII small subunit [Bacteriovoracales bacterium]
MEIGIEEMKKAQTNGNGAPRREAPTGKWNMAQKTKNLEQKLAELEKIINLLEKNEFDLDENIKNFEKGAQLYKECKSILGLAEKKIKKLTDSLKEENFD